MKDFLYREVGGMRGLGRRTASLPTMGTAPGWTGSETPEPG